MSIESSVNGSALTIRVTGRFDFSAHREFRAAAEKIGNGVNSVTVDMRMTDYIDSSALGMLLILKDKVSGEKSAIKIINSSPEVKKILEIASFGQLFTLN